MNRRLSGVTMAMAELPEKFVRYRMFERDVTISASTFERTHAARTASCRRLSVALGAGDMDGVQEFLKSGDCRIFLRHRRVDQEFLRGLLEGQALGRVHAHFRLDLTREIRDGLLEIGIVPRDGERRAVLGQGVRE